MLSYSERCNDDRSHLPLPYAVDCWSKTCWTTASRYYIAEVTQDLFGTWLLKRSWGGLGSRRGSSMTIPAENYEEALSLLADTAKRRQQRGYVRAE